VTDEEAKWIAKAALAGVTFTQQGYGGASTCGWTLPGQRPEFGMFTCARAAVWALHMMGLLVSEERKIDILARLPTVNEPIDEISYHD
jgi:hypothetical protein